MHELPATLKPDKPTDKLDDKLKTVLDIFDDVFQQLGQPRLLDNKLFKVKTDLQFDHYLRFDRADRQDNEIALFFELSNDGATFHIDRTDEIPEWSFTMIQNDTDKFRQLLLDLFTSSILTEHKGNKTILRLFDKDGRQIRRFTFYRGLGFYFLSKSDFKLYRPIFNIAL
jgi:hypothetical protein